MPHTIIDASQHVVKEERPRTGILHLGWMLVETALDMTVHNPWSCCFMKGMTSRSSTIGARTDPSKRKTMGYKV